MKSMDKCGNCYCRYGYNCEKFDRPIDDVFEKCKCKKTAPPDPLIIWEKAIANRGGKNGN